MSLLKSNNALLLLIPALLIYAGICQHLSFTQDDAYITYRYAANYLNGDGLVYNVGERVEGYTNFGWLIYLIVWGAWGVDFIAVSKITGVALGAGCVLLTFLVARALLVGRDRWWSFSAAYLAASSQSLAYWSPAGLETAPFAFLVMLAFYLYLKRSWGLVAALILAVWVRPEGALLAGLLIISGALVNRTMARFAIACTAMAFLASIPFVVFKLVYYGSIFPNPFFAKTGWNVDHIRSGLEYVGRFFSHYPVYGIGLLMSVVLTKKLSPGAKAAVWLAWLYVAYLILIGGDVLKVHRFFVPILGLLAVVTAVSMSVFVSRAGQRLRSWLVIVATVALAVITYLVPNEFVDRFNARERSFTRKMAFLASELEKSDGRDFSVALPTIGIFGYRLLGHDIIDMVGLTDTTIARYAEAPIPDMQTTWKEKKHNSSYLLKRAPDYIVFSTGIKPSAPAERALLLYAQFLRCYRTVGWYQEAEKPGATGLVHSAYKRVRDPVGEPVATYPVAYVEHYKKGLDVYSVRHREAIDHFDRALAVSPRPAYVYVQYYKAFCHMMLQQHDIAQPLMDSIIQEDSLVYEAHKDLYMYALLSNDRGKAAVHARWLRRLVPWYWPRIKSQVDRLVAATRRRRH